MVEVTSDGFAPVRFFLRTTYRHETWSLASTFGIAEKGQMFGYEKKI
jgi:hypothetical protein